MVIGWSQYLSSSPETLQVLSQYMFFQWDQQNHRILTRWKTLISNYSDIDKKNLYQNHHVIKGIRILSTDKLSSTEIYLILISSIAHKPTANIYFEKL